MRRFLLLAATGLGVSSGCDSVGVANPSRPASSVHEAFGVQPGAVREAFDGPKAGDSRQLTQQARLVDEGQDPPWRWDEQVARVLDSTTLARELGYRPPRGTEAYAAIIQHNELGLSYAFFDYDKGAFSQSFWPASTVKVLAALAALDWLRIHGFSGQAEVRWRNGFSDRVNAIVDRSVRLSSNEDYDRTLQIAGLDHLNGRWLTAERGFPNTVIQAAYAHSNVRTPPSFTLTEGDKQWVVPSRTTGPLDKCSGARVQCATLFELTEAVRRVVLRDLIPPQERFELSSEDSNALQEALCQAKPSFFARGVRAVLGPDARICHKPGWVPGKDYLDHGVMEAADGRRFLLAAAMPDPGDGSAQGRLPVLAEKILRVITRLEMEPFYLQPTAGAEIRVKKEAGGLRVQGEGFDEVQVYIDGTGVDRVRRDEETFFAEVTTESWQDKLMTVRGYRQGAIVGVRNLVLP
ncbi:MAG TPA: hypothetical protein PLJ27_02990 [Polyangiaceae bacterium]|nr:hypothetical protein [Polyangiaceae bacterium]HNZ22217.1 hypothetical protein [Polyangiaceae bacterium]HOD22268.1 hypothetical protein [Polyangiaceae bacterium]HOE47041.1 hypothetical protein [Polyangiaceae bacterium]HOG99886.1 hypothetical protein [Polyangiaceae bacterium]